jgi:hypothetical protein
MKRSLFVIPLVVLLASFLPAPLVPSAVAGPTSFSFTFIKPNTAENPSTGDTIRMTGSGSFDTSSLSIVASGSFTHTTASGTVVARGTWQATSPIIGFMSIGGPNPGEQAGLLRFKATLVPDVGPSISDLIVTFTCVFDGFTLPGLKDGTTIGAFTIITGGLTLFHVNQ